MSSKVSTTAATTTTTTSTAAATTATTKREKVTVRANIRKSRINVKERHKKIPSVSRRSSNGNEN